MNNSESDIEQEIVEQQTIPKLQQYVVPDQNHPLSISQIQKVIAMELALKDKIAIKDQSRMLTLENNAKHLSQQFQPLNHENLNLKDLVLAQNFYIQQRCLDFALLVKDKNNKLESRELLKQIGDLVTIHQLLQEDLQEYEGCVIYLSEVKIQLTEKTESQGKELSSIQQEHKNLISVLRASHINEMQELRDQMNSIIDDKIKSQDTLEKRIIELQFLLAFQEKEFKKQVQWNENLNYSNVQKELQTKKDLAQMEKMFLESKDKYQISIKMLKDENVKVQIEIRQAYETRMDNIQIQNAQDMEFSMDRLKSAVLLQNEQNIIKIQLEERIIQMQQEYHNLKLDKQLYEQQAFKSQDRVTKLVYDNQAKDRDLLEALSQNEILQASEIYIKKAFNDLQQKQKSEKVKARLEQIRINQTVAFISSTAEENQQLLQKQYLRLSVAYPEINMYPEIIRPDNFLQDIPDKYLDYLEWLVTQLQILQSEQAHTKAFIDWNQEILQKLDIDEKDRKQMALDFEQQREKNIQDLQRKYNDLMRKNQALERLSQTQQEDINASRFQLQKLFSQIQVEASVKRECKNLSESQLVQFTFSNIDKPVQNQRSQNNERIPMLEKNQTQRSKQISQKRNRSEISNNAKMESLTNVKGGILSVDKILRQSSVNNNTSDILIIHNNENDLNNGIEKNNENNLNNEENNEINQKDKTKSSDIIDNDLQKINNFCDNNTLNIEDDNFRSIKIDYNHNISDLTNSNEDVVLIDKKEDVKRQKEDVKRQQSDSIHSIDDAQLEKDQIKSEKYLCDCYLRQRLVAKQINQQNDLKETDQIYSRQNTNTDEIDINVRQQVTTSKVKKDDRIQTNFEEQIANLKIFYEKKLKDLNEICVRQLEERQQHSEDKLKSKNQDIESKVKTMKQLQSSLEEQQSKVAIQTSKCEEQDIKIKGEEKINQDFQSQLKILQNEFDKLKQQIQIREDKISSEFNVKLGKKDEDMQQQINQLAMRDKIISEREDFIQELKQEIERFEDESMVRQTYHDHQIRELKDKQLEEIDSTLKKLEFYVKKVKNLQITVTNQPSKPEDIERIRQLVKDNMTMKTVLETHHSRLSHVTEIVKYLQLELENYKNTYNIFQNEAGSQKESNNKQLKNLYQNFLNEAQEFNSKTSNLLFQQFKQPKSKLQLTTYRDRERSLDDSQTIDKYQNKTQSSRANMFPEVLTCKNFQDDNEPTINFKTNFSEDNQDSCFRSNNLLKNVQSRVKIQNRYNQSSKFKNPLNPLDSYEMIKNAERFVCSLSRDPKDSILNDASSVNKSTIIKSRNDNSGHKFKK